MWKQKAMRRSFGDGRLSRRDLLGACSLPVFRSHLSPQLFGFSESELSCYVFFAAWFSHLAISVLEET